MGTFKIVSYKAKMVWPFILFGALYLCYMLVAHTVGTCCRNCVFFGRFTLVAIVMILVTYQVAITTERARLAV